MTDREKEFEALTKPISDWLYENGTPHSMVIIQQDHAELLGGKMVVSFILKD